MGRPPSHPSTRHPSLVPGGGRCAHSGIPERPAPSPVPSFPARSLLLGAAFRLVAPGSGGRGTAREPGSPGGGGPSPRPAGMRLHGARLRGRARRGGLERGVCCLRSWRRTLVPAALRRGGGHKAIQGPRPPAALRGPPARRDPAKLPSPPSPFPRPQAPAPLGPPRPRLCNGSAGYVLGALPAQALGARPAIQRAGPAAGWVCGVRAGQVPRQLRACRHSAARPGPRRPRQARASGRTRAASLGALATAPPAPRPARRARPRLPEPVRGPPSPPPGDTSGPGPGRPARGCGGGGRGRRAAAGGRERARAPARRPARPFRLLRARRCPPHPGQPLAAPPSLRALCRLPGRSLASRPGPVTCPSAPPAPVPLCTVHRRARACLCTRVARTPPACVCRHAHCHICVRGAVQVSRECAPRLHARDGRASLSRLSPLGRPCVCTAGRR